MTNLTVFTFAFVLFLAVQVRGDVTSEEATDRDSLNIIKQLAMNAISGYHKQVVDFASKYRDLMQKMSAEVFEEISRKIEETAVRANAKVKEIAERLVEEGRKEDKPPAYFDCINKYRERTAHAVGLLLTKYKKDLNDRVRDWQDAFQPHLLTVELLRMAADGLLESARERIYACTDTDCIEAEVKAASIAFSRPKSVVLMAVEKFFKEYTSYVESLYGKATDAEASFADAVMEGTSHMYLC